MGDKTVDGSCLCGAVKFRIELPTLFCGHCHCSMCRRNHGSAYVTWLAVDRSQLSLLEGEEALHRYASSEHGSRSFCDRCGSSLFCVSDEHPERVDIPLANVEGPIDRPPQLHVYFDDRADWAFVDDGLPRLGGGSGMEPVKSEE
ncbi:MAG: ribulose phosphate epimerase [Deltaproteobacteria bacterium]|jgi:hypothetical protein|nr:ribulose phosphate epimerase [Deltaproteobacteria bacterium]